MEVAVEGAEVDAEDGDLDAGVPGGGVHAADNLSRTGDRSVWRWGRGSKGRVGGGLP